MTVKSYEIAVPMNVDRNNSDSSGESSPASSSSPNYRTPNLSMRQNVVEEAKKRRKKKKRSERTLIASSFSDLYKLTGETLGEGSYGKVETCVNVYTGIEYAVKTIEKRPGFYSRSKVMKEIEIYYVCQGHNNIIQLIEYFEEAERFYLIFEKINGGPLLDHIQARICFTEAEASAIVKDLADSLKFLHGRGIAHRDLKPENVLCVNPDFPCPVKLCDFDLCSEAHNSSSTPQLLTPVGSCEYMAPEVVNTFIAEEEDDEHDDQELYYNKKCDLWSLGVIMYILLCGYPPFSGNCGSDCGWDRGETCHVCQNMLFTSIQEGRVVFLERDWSSISHDAKDLIGSLLVKDTSHRLDAVEVLEHPWIVNGGCSNHLDTPRNLRRQTSTKELVEFAASAVDVNRAMVEQRASETMSRRAVKIPTFQRFNSCHTFDLSPPIHSTCSLLERRRASKSRRNQFDKVSKFMSIDEFDLDRDDSERARFFIEDIDFSSRR